MKPHRTSVMRYRLTCTLNETGWQLLLAGLLHRKGSIPSGRFKCPRAPGDLPLQARGTPARESWASTSHGSAPMRRGASFCIRPGCMEWSFCGLRNTASTAGQSSAFSPDAAIVVVHILSPYGMAWLRRVNENNVDLNRNFRHGRSSSDAPSKYAKLDSFLNPRTPPGSDLYFAKAAYLILRHGMTTLKQSVVGGQYEFSKGLFFGGTQLEDGPQKYLGSCRAARTRGETTSRRCPYRTRQVCGTPISDTQDYARLRSLFGKDVQGHNRIRAAYGRRRTGVDGLPCVFRRTSNFVCQEFWNMQRHKVLHALQRESRCTITAGNVGSRD